MDNGNFMDLLPRLAILTAAIDKMKAEQEEIKQKVMEGMKEQQLNKIDTANITVTYVASTIRESFDSTRFKKECPDTYKDFIKTSPVSESLKLKVKENN